MIENSEQGMFRFGGDSLNTALYLARTSLNSELSVSYATVVGTETHSHQLLKVWQTEGINTDLVLALDDKSLGSYKIKLNDEGERSFIYERSDSAAKQYMKIGYDQLWKKLLDQNTDFFYFTGISLAILPEHDLEPFFTLLTVFKKGGGKIIFDNNYRPALWQHCDPIPHYQQAMELCDTAFLTDEDEYALFGGESIEAILARYEQSYGLKQTELVIKQGAAPCFVRPKANDLMGYSPESIIQVKSQKIPDESIVDTSAAGDAFSAGYLAKRLTGRCISSSVTFGHLLAGRVIQYHGAVIPIHAMNDLTIKETC